jgi:mycothiol synthase
MGDVDRADGLEPWVTESDVREDLGDPDLDLETDTWVVADGAQVAGYAELWNAREEEAHALEAQCWTAPTHLGRGIGSVLLDKTEEAAAAAARTLSRRPLLLRNFVWANSRSARAMLEGRGYRLVRHYFHMAIDLAELRPPPPLPDGLVLRWFDVTRDAREVHALIDEAFRDHWNWSPISFESFWRRVGERDDFDGTLTPLVFEGGRLVGVSLNGTKIGQGWVEDLAVARDARRRGIGEFLLHQTFARFKEKGWTKVGLGLDSSNPTGALRLYERVGMHVTRGFDAYEKVVAS